MTQSASIGEPFRFSLTQLHRFLTVADELHFSRAAEALGVSQPMLSRQIQDLEFAIGARLFLRTSRRVELTPAGAIFRDRVRSLLTGLRDSSVLASEVGSGRRGPIRIGYTDEFTRFLLPQLVARLKEEDRKAEIHLVLASVPQLLEQIGDASIDFALLCPMPISLGPEPSTFPVRNWWSAFTATIPRQGASGLRWRTSSIFRSSPSWSRIPARNSWRTSCSRSRGSRGRSLNAPATRI